MIDKVNSNPFSSQHKIIGKEEKNVNKEELNAVNEKSVSVSVNVSKEKMEKVIQDVNKFLQPSHTSLKFEFHEKLNEYYVKVIDDSTQETVREIPSKKLLDMYAAMTEYFGLFMDKKI